MSLRRLEVGEKKLSVIFFSFMILLIPLSFNNLKTNYQNFTNSSFGLYEQVPVLYILFAYIFLYSSIIFGYKKERRLFWISLFIALLLRLPFSVIKNISISDQLYREGLVKKLIMDTRILEHYDYFRFPMAIIHPSQFSIITHLSPDLSLRIISIVLHILVILIFYSLLRSLDTSSKVGYMLTTILVIMTGVPSSIFYSPWLYSISLTWMFFLFTYKYIENTKNIPLIILGTTILLSHQAISIVGISFFLIFFLLIKTFYDQKEKIVFGKKYFIVFYFIGLLFIWWIYGKGGTSVIYNIWYALVNYGTRVHTSPNIYIEIYPPWEKFRIYAYYWIRIYLVSLVILVLIKYRNQINIRNNIRKGLLSLINRKDKIEIFKFSLFISLISIIIFLKTFFNFYYDRFIIDIFSSILLIALVSRKNNFPNKALFIFLLIATIFALPYLFGMYTPAIIFAQDKALGIWMVSGNIDNYQGDGRILSVINSINGNIIFDHHTEKLSPEAKGVGLFTEFSPIRYSHTNNSYHEIIAICKKLIKDSNLLFNNNVAMVFYN